MEPPQIKDTETMERMSSGSFVKTILGIGNKYDALPTSSNVADRRASDPLNDTLITLRDRMSDPDYRSSQKHWRNEIERYGVDEKLSTLAADAGLPDLSRLGDKMVRADKEDEDRIHAENYEFRRRRERGDSYRKLENRARRGKD
jgi:hypothetical protein